MPNPSVYRAPLRGLAVLAGALAGTAGAARADIIWNEIVQGDLSDDRFAPTPLPIAPGDNELLGILSGGNDQHIDRDYYTITIPEGYVLAQIILELYFSVDYAAFIAIQPGAIFPNDPDSVIPSDLLGWAHFGPNEQGTDLLALLGSHGQGFTPPLPAGAYSFWAQQLDDYTDYALNFVVEVPAPGSALLFAAPLMVLRRRRG